MANQKTTPEKHKGPTDTTIKELYGSAVECAFPDCEETPYISVGEALALNSQVAHIHARSENGPRWLASMTETQNRAKTNLLILCFPHHDLVDDPENVTQYPADKLRSWKKAQVELATHSQRRRPILLSKEQIKEVRRVMDDAGSSRTDRILLLVRAVARFIATIEQRREESRAIAIQWQEEIDRWKRTPVGWVKETGENVYASPSSATKAEYRKRIDAALGQAATDVKPLLIDLEAELMAATSGAADVEPWIVWFRRSVDEVANEASLWQWSIAPNEDKPLLSAIAMLREAQDALARRLRGEDAPEPPAVLADHGRDEVDDPWAHHLEVLGRGRPFIRAEARAYDAELREEVAAQTAFACQLPQAHPFLSEDVTATSMIAAYIARRASDDEIEALIVSDEARQPAAAAAFLLSLLEEVLEQDSRTNLAAQAHTALERLVAQFVWDDPEQWVVNGLSAGSMVDLFALVTSSENVKEQLSHAARASPYVGARIVLAVARTSTAIDHGSGAMTLRSNFRHPQEWLPVADLVESADALPEEQKTEDLRRLIDELKRLSNTDVE